MRSRGNIFYLGQFPPPYGGVTVKNALLFESLAQHLSIEALPFRSSGVFPILRTVLCSRHGKFVLGFGNGRIQKSYLLFMNMVSPAVLSRSYLVVMGGGFSAQLGEDKRLLSACKRLAKIYVETEGMVEVAKAAGLKNACLFPNCRVRPAKPASVRKSDERLKCVFFSYVSPEKGIDLVLEAARQLPNIDFSVYGRLDESYIGEFSSAVAQTNNLDYHGVFDSVSQDAVSELNKYDVHLFPTRWPAEGVPGVLVETKIAAVPSIVSNICFNAELVRDREEGLVLEEFSVESLVNAIDQLDANRALLASLKEKALASAERFYLDNYIDGLVSDLTDCG